MRQTLLLSLLFIASAFTISAQNYTVKGTVLDTFNNNKLENASLVLIRSKDSTMAAYTRSKADGSFSLKVDSGGSYLLLVSYPSFADYVDFFELKDPGERDLGNVSMVTRSNLLSEFVLKQKQGAIHIKGDTTEYSADSFLVRPGATVEDLLKKLPGLEVDRNGQITAQGEKVQRILVDGEEFFSDDPAVVTKNLQSSVVDVVQVYDKKSDQADFTGIDDGVKTKTINLQLKEDKKKGYFGKVNLSGGEGDVHNTDGGTKPNGYFENQGMLNAFRGKRQLSVFGIMSNTGTVGLNWRDANKFSDNGGSIFGDEDRDWFSFSFNDGDDADGTYGWQSNYNGQGLPAVWTGGLHYADKWAADKQHFAGNYRFSRQNFETEGSTLTQYVLPDSVYYTDQHSNSFSTGDRHRGDGLYEWKIDSMATLKVTADGGYTKVYNSTGYQTQSMTGNNTLINTSNRLNSNNGTTSQMNASVIWRQRFKKKSRTLSLQVDEGYRRLEGDGLLKSEDVFYIANLPIASDSTDQMKKTNTSRFNITGSSIYTEPLSKNYFLEFRYGLDVDNNQSKKFSYNKTTGGEEYDVLDSLYSSNYDYNVLTNKGGAYLRFVNPKYKISIGGMVSATSFKQTDLLTSIDYNRNFTNFFPSATFDYKPNQQADLFLSYTGSTRQPTIDQIQPIRQNTDPLNISIGNPDLKQAFQHNIQARYNTYKVLTQRYVYMGAYAMLTDNAISSSETVDNFGRRNYQYVNVDGNYNVTFYGGLGMGIKQVTGLRVGLNSYLSLNHLNNIVNGVKNTSNNNVYQVGLNFNYDVDKKFNFSYAPEFTYSQNTATINSNLQNYWSFSHNFDGSVELPWKMEINAGVEWFLRERTEVFDQNNNVFTLNAWISKKFLKKDNLELRISAFDILNQKIGYTRYAQNNFVSENHYNTIGRYGMISLIWNFTHSPLTNAAAPPPPPPAAD